MNSDFLSTVLVCPECRGNLRLAPDHVRCLECGGNYPQRSPRWIDLSSPSAEGQNDDDWEGRQVQCESWYEDLIQDPESAYHTLRVDIEPFADVLREMTGDILDVGGGIGVVRDYLPGGGNYVSLDPSVRWLLTDWSVLGHRFPALRTLPCFVRGVAERLPFRSASFDAVLSMWSLNHVAGQRQALAEMTRVVKTGGRLLLVLEDMAPRWRDPLSSPYWGGGTRYGLARLVTKAVRGMTGRSYPIQPDHYAVKESQIRNLLGPEFRHTRRSWRGRYLFYHLDDKLAVG